MVKIGGGRDGCYANYEVGAYGMEWVHNRAPERSRLLFKIMGGKHYGLVFEPNLSTLKCLFTIVYTNNSRQPSTSIANFT